MNDISKQILEYFSLDSSVLFDLANKIRQEYIGDDVEVRALLEISNICKNHCQYCGLRAPQKNERYKMQFQEIVDYAHMAKDVGYKTIVMQSGESDIYGVDEIINIISKIKDMDMAITLSLGEKSFEEYRAYKEAGADRYLLRIETTDEILYKQMHPNQDLKNRKQCLYNLKELGYEVGSGSLIGLPGQSIEILAKDVEFFYNLDVDMIGVGPFIPVFGTPLAGEPHGNLELAIKMMAIIRLVLKNVNIPATTAMETLSKGGRKKALQSGANVVMINIGGENYKDKYQLYKRQKVASYQEIETEIISIGRSVSQTKGFRKK